VPGLPAESIVCVRHLQARLNPHRLRHAGGLLATADQLSRQLLRHAGEARRPARETVSDTAQAVRFDDPAEMLVCAAHDWLDGNFARQWWWRSLLDSCALARGAAALWQRHPAHIPAALATLDNHAGEFAGRLPASDAASLVRLLIARHALPEQRPAAPDWIPRLPGLTPDDPRQRFLTLGLLLAHAPALARALQPSQAAEGGDRHALACDDASPRSPPDDETAAADPGLSQRLPAEQTWIPSAQANDDASPRRGPAARKPDLRRGSRTERDDEVGFVRHGFVQALPGLDQPAQNTAAAQPSPAQRRSEAGANPPTRTRDTGRYTPAPAIAFAQSPIAQPEPAPPQTAPFALTSEQLETRYGGVLYLLNLALHLDFYADFTRPNHPGLTLSPWHFLALTGERLAGRGLLRDALWPLLVRLAGGDEVEFTAAPPLPTALQPYVRMPCRAEKRSAFRRPYVAHPAEGAALFRPTKSNTWTTWLDSLLPPLRRRLAAALGVPVRQISGVLCRQPARIQVSPARLEAHFNLNDHPLAIRLAGLDRDPGWIPAAGRDVRFFYD
jgi:hypothetical protein